MTDPIHTQTVAEFLTYHIDNHSKTQREIALELGYQKSNMITMFKQGLTRLPLDKVGPLANALGIDSGALFYMVLREYMPNTLDALKPIMQRLELSPEEAKLIDDWRLIKSLTIDGNTN